MIPFNISEKMLEQEIRQNPKSCPRCQIWQSGGDMSSALFDCEYCGTKEAKSDIKRLINQHADKHSITYDQAWSIANNLLMTKRKQNGGIYFCEDYFYCDLSEHFNLI